MSTLAGDEPELQLGDSGEHVTQLQDRLRGLGLLTKFPDGTFDAETEAAVQQVQGSLGLTADGTVKTDTWEALDRHMLDQGLQYNAYAAPGQQHWDLPQGDLAQGDATQGQELAGHEATHTQQQAVEPYWDGEKWLQYDPPSQQWLPMQQDAAAEPATAEPATAEPTIAEPTIAEPATAEAAPVVPHIDNIHPAIRDDERFSSFHDFLRETHA